jgi:hypothetical protein
MDAARPVIETGVVGVLGQKRGTVPTIFPSRAGIVKVTDRKIMQTVPLQVWTV